MVSKKQHAIAFMLPTTVAGIVPAILLVYTASHAPWFSYPLFQNPFSTILGIMIIILGFSMLVATIQKFAREGEGTLSPHAPPQKLVVTGPYRYVRNPMINGVLFMVLGEAIFFSSFSIFLLFVLFFAGNHIYFIKSEEPGLISRFGEEYIEYMQNVPRWIPRRTPWSPDEVGSKEN